MKQIDPNKYSSYFVKYIDRVSHLSLSDALEESLHRWEEQVESIPAERLDYAYDEGKWTIAQVLTHLTDTERVMSYRALRFSRGDNTELHGYDHDAYADATLGKTAHKDLLLSEGTVVRLSSQALFSSLNDDELGRVGHFNGNRLSVEGLGYLIAGHQFHHMEVIAERYI